MFGMFGRISDLEITMDESSQATSDNHWDGNEFLKCGRDTHYEGRGKV